MGATGLIELDRLRAGTNPFSAATSGLRAGRPLQAALGELIRLVGLETSVVIVAGSVGMGKSLLVEMAARTFSGMGLTVRRFERGDLIPAILGERSDVLLIDEADSLADAAMTTLLRSADMPPATTIVLLCLPTSVLRLISSGAQAAIIQLQALSPSDARNFLLERAASMGRSDLFATDALDLIVNGSQGMPRVLRSAAERAFAEAARDGASQIALNHAAYALAFEVRPDITKKEPVSKPKILPVDPPAPKPKESTATFPDLRSVVKQVPAKDKIADASPAAPSAGRAALMRISSASGRVSRRALQFAHIAATFVVVFVLVGGLLNFLMANTGERMRSVAMGTSRTLAIRPIVAQSLALPNSPSGNHAIGDLVQETERSPVAIPRPKPTDVATVSRSAARGTGPGTSQNVPPATILFSPASNSPNSEPLPDVVSLPPSAPALPEPVEQFRAQGAVVQEPVVQSEAVVEAGEAAKEAPSAAAASTNPFYSMATLKEADEQKPKPAQGSIRQAAPVNTTVFRRTVPPARERARIRNQAFFGGLLEIDKTKTVRSN